MLGVITFALMGALAGVLAGWTFFAFERSNKIGSGAVSVALVGGETYLALKVFIPEGTDPSTLVFTLISASVISFFVAIFVLILIINNPKNQAANFKITLVDIIFNNRQALDEYQKSRTAEIDRQLKSELNIEQLEKQKLELDAKCSELSAKEKAWQCEIDEARSLLGERDELFDSKFSITIPQRYKHGIKADFFDLLPRHVTKIGAFYSKLRPLTESFLSKKLSSANRDEIFESYLFGVAGYIRTCLFDQSSSSGENEVRVHFRVLDKATMTYKG